MNSESIIILVFLFFLVCFAFWFAFFRHIIRRNKLQKEAKALQMKQAWLGASQKLLQAYFIGFNTSDAFINSTSGFCEEQRDIFRRLLVMFQKLEPGEASLLGTNKREKKLIENILTYGKAVVDRTIGKDLKQAPPQRPFLLTFVNCPICLNNFSRKEMVSRINLWHCPVCDYVLYSHFPGDQAIF